MVKNLLFNIKLKRIKRLKTFFNFYIIYKYYFFSIKNMFINIVFNFNLSLKSIYIKFKYLKDLCL